MIASILGPEDRAASWGDTMNGITENMQWGVGGPNKPATPQDIAAVMQRGTVIESADDYGNPIRIGDEVIVFDHAVTRQMKGENASYTVGVVIGFQPELNGCSRYIVLANRKHPVDAPDLRLHFPPINGCSAGALPSYRVVRSSRCSTTGEIDRLYVPTA